MRDPATDPAVRRRLAMARYARSHSKAAAARHYGCCWATIQAAVRRVEEYERTQDVRCLQNKARGKSHRTLASVEERTVAIYQESADPPRPNGRRYSAAKVGRLLEDRADITLSRSTVWRILKRRGVWAPHPTQKSAIQRFERPRPNELWQIDLIEQEPTAIGDVYGVPIVDDHSRYLCALRFFLDKGADTTLRTTYLAMKECGTPEEMLCDRGGQFVDPTGTGETHFEEVLEALGIDLQIAWRAQTKGKEERLNQFIERDFLDQVRWQVSSLEELNQLADAWRESYNHTHVHETTHYVPARRYTTGVKVDDALLRQLFATEERRKVTREAKVRYRNHQIQVPEQYIGASVWVADFFGEQIEIRCGTQTIGTYEL
jgi:transposase